MQAKPILITGGSRGIGRAIAIRLGADGWRPLIVCRSHIKEAHEAAELSGGVACPFGADLGSLEGCRKVWEWAVSMGPVRGLVNNAGVYVQGSFTERDEREFEASFSQAMSVNFMAPVRLSRWFAQQASKGDRILNVCSRVGFRGEAGAAAYAASKAAQINLVRSLAVELAGLGIGVFGIAPGWVETAMTRKGMEERRAEIEGSIPLGRVASPEDCANAAAFLLSDEAAYLSGVVLDVNGASYLH